MDGWTDGRWWPASKMAPPDRRLLDLRPYDATPDTEQGLPLPEQSPVGGTACDVGGWVMKAWWLLVCSLGPLSGPATTL